MTVLCTADELSKQKKTDSNSRNHFTPKIMKRVRGGGGGVMKLTASASPKKLNFHAFVTSKQQLLRNKSQSKKAASA